MTQRSTPTKRPTTYRQMENGKNETPQLSWREWLSLISPHGQQQMIDWVRDAREKRGANWLAEIAAEYPLFSWIAELVCSMDADDALSEIEAAYPHWPIRMIAGGKLKELHAR